MGEYTVYDDVLVEVAVVGRNNSGDYEVRFKNMYDTFWLPKKYVRPMVPTKTYEDGLNEAWETARRIGKLWGDGGLSTDELREVFGITMTSSVFRENTAAEAAAKIAAWEDGKQLRVGDVVDVGEKGTDSYVGGAVVTGRDEDRYFLLFNDGETGAFKEKHLTKTGRTVDIKAVLEAIGGGD